MSKGNEEATWNVSLCDLTEGEGGSSAWLVTEDKSWLKSYACLKM